MNIYQIQSPLHFSECRQPSGNVLKLDSVCCLQYVLSVYTQINSLCCIWMTPANCSEGMNCNPEVLKTVPIYEDFSSDFYYFCKIRCLFLQSDCWCKWCRVQTTRHVCPSWRSLCRMRWLQSHKILPGVTDYKLVHDQSSYMTCVMSSVLVLLLLVVLQP